MLTVLLRVKNLKGQIIGILCADSNNIISFIPRKEYNKNTYTNAKISASGHLLTDRTRTYVFPVSYKILKQIRTYTNPTLTDLYNVLQVYAPYEAEVVLRQAYWVNNITPIDVNTTEQQLYTLIMAQHCNNGTYTGLKRAIANVEKENSDQIRLLRVFGKRAY